MCVLTSICCVCECVQLVSRVYSCLFSRFECVRAVAVAAVVVVIVMLTFLIVRQSIRFSIDILASSLPACLLPPLLSARQPTSLHLPMSPSLLDFNLLNYSQFASFARLFESLLLSLSLPLSLLPLPTWLRVCVRLHVRVCVFVCLYCAACVTVSLPVCLFVYIAFRFASLIRLIHSCFCTFCACFDFLIFLP